MVEKFEGQEGALKREIRNRAISSRKKVGDGHKKARVDTQAEIIAKEP